MKNYKPNNPNAFPSDYSFGMTLRDYFAANAMQSILQNPSYTHWTKERFLGVAIDAYAIADAMLKQREIKTEE